MSLSATVLADPRRYARTSPQDVIAQLAAALAGAGDEERGARARALTVAVAASFEAGDGETVARSLAGAPDARVARALHIATARAADRPLGAPGSILLRSFALPLVIVAGAARRTQISAVLPDVSVLAALFEKHGAMGQTRNFGLSNALTAYDDLAALSPVAVFRATRTLERVTLADALPPRDLIVEPGRERAHLRFLVGAGIVAADAPSFTETAANVGAWGMPCARAIASALGQAGLQLLVLPRPPVDLVQAPQAGRKAQLEVALNLFVSNTVRRMRLQVGDPTAILSTHEDGDLRLTLSSVFADDLVEGFRWPLHHLDDLDEVQRIVASLLSEVRVTDVRVVDRVLAAARPGGSAWFPRAGEWTALSEARSH